MIGIHVRTFLLLISFSGIAAAALSQSWVLILDSEQIVAEFNRDSVKKFGNRLEADFRFTHIKPIKNKDNGLEYTSAVVTSRFDCISNSYAPFKRVEFSGPNATGEQIAVVELPNAKMQPVTPGAVNEMMLIAACDAEGSEK